MEEDNKDVGESVGCVTEGESIAVGDFILCQYSVKKKTMQYVGEVQ